MNTCQIKVVLKYTYPPVWRRLQVPADIALDALHDVLQIAMGWKDAHLHQFVVNGDCYGVYDPQFPNDMQNESSYLLSDLVGEGEQLTYEYDFGDGWIHEIKIEKMLVAEPGKHYPLCLGGERTCPPEDSGGPPGYEHILEVLRDPKHKEYAELSEWAGEAFDPEAFNPNAVNSVLSSPR